MKAFEPYALSLENYVGRRLLALLAALALADIVILLSVTMSSAVFASMGGGAQEVVRARAIEVLNDQGRPVLVATADQGLNGVLWVSDQHGRGGVSLSTDPAGNGTLVLNGASGAPLLSATASDREGGSLQMVDDQGRNQVFLGASQAGSGQMSLWGREGALLVVAGEDRGNGLLLANNSQGTNIFMVGADSAANGGLLVNSRTGANLIYAGSGPGGNGGLHINSDTGDHLIFLGADETGEGAVGIWDSDGLGSILKK